MIMRANGHKVEIGNMQTPHHGHAPIPMRRVLREDEFERLGDFAWRVIDGRRSMIVAIPRPSDGRSAASWVLSSWTIDHKNECDAQWGWDGNVDRPTLTPSLHAVGVWHGRVTRGELVEA